MVRTARRRAFLAFAVLSFVFGWAVVSQLVTFEQPLAFVLQFVNETSSSCQLPRLDPFDAEILPFLKKKDVFCHPIQKIVKYDSDGHLVQVGHDHECSYKCLKRENDYENDEYSDPWRPLTPGKPVAPNCDVTKTKCSSSLLRTTVDFDLYPNHAPEHLILKSDVSSPSILMLMLDGLSSSSFYRNLGDSVRYFTETMGGFHFEKHFKVGLNTFPNMMAVLTGARVWDHGNQQSDFGATRTTFEKMKMDNFSFVWKDFARNGYATSFFEDFSDYATFTYSAGGFVEPPTDHYFRPYVIARQLRPFVSCADGMFVMNKTIQVPRAVIRRYSKQRFFSLNIFGLPSHDSHDQAHLLDPIYLQFFREHFETGDFNQTVIIFFSDHGARSGEVRSTTVGYMEEQLPFLGIYLPPNFREKYPHFVGNLKANTERLTSQFDLHATLSHFLSLSLPYYTTHNGRGTSLFSALPENRTCGSAGIPDDVCLCNKHAVQPLSTRKSLHLAQRMIEVINEKAKSLPICEAHRLLKVMSAYRDSGRIRLTFQSTAAGALFEVFLDANGEPTSKIERINIYENTAKCVSDWKIRPYCVCKDR